MDFPDFLSPTIPIILHSQQILQTSSSSCTQQISINSCWSSNHWHVHVLGSIEECHLGGYQYVSNSIQHILFIFLGWIFEMRGKWPYSCCLVGMLLPRFVQNCIVFLFSSNLAFFPCVLLASMWCIHIVVLIQPQRGKDRSDFHIIDNFSIATNTYAKCMLTSLSTDKRLLPRYVNLFTNFRGLPLRKWLHLV